MLVCGTYLRLFVFQFIPDMFSRDEVRDLCSPVEFFHSKLGRHGFMDHSLYTEVSFCWKRFGPLRFSEES